MDIRKLLENSEHKFYYGSESELKNYSNRVMEVAELLKKNPDSVGIKGSEQKITAPLAQGGKVFNATDGRFNIQQTAFPKQYVSKDIYDAAVKFNEEYDKETKRVEAEEADAENKSKTLQFLAEIDAKWNGGASNQEIADETITAIVDNRNSHTYYKKEQNSISVEDVKKVAAQIKNKPKQTQTLLSVGGIPKEIYDLAVIYNNMLDRRSGLLSAADIEAIKLAHRYESIGATPGKPFGGIGFADAVDKYITSEDLNSKEYNDLVKAYQKGNVEELVANNKVFTGKNMDKILFEDIWEKINPRKVVGTGSDGTKFYNKYAYNQYLESQRMNNKEAEVIKNIRREHHIISGIQELAAKKATEAFAKDKKLNATVHNIINGHKSVDVRDQYYKYSKLTEAEKLIYNYYVMQQTSDMDSSIAGKYLKEIDSRLEERAAVDLAEDMNGLEKTLHMAGQGIESGMLNVARAGAGLKGEELSSLYDETDQERLSRAIINGEDNDVARFFYQAIQTTSEQLPSIGLGVATNGVGYFAMLSTSVVGSSVTEAMRNNKTLIEGVTYGTVQAVMEIALDKLLGGIGGKFLGKGLSNVVVKTLDKIDNIFTSKIPKNLLKGAVVHLESAGGEGLQEFIQGIADPAIRNVIYQENNTYSLDTLGEALYQGLLGFASGFALGGSNASMAQTQAQYETIGNGLIDTHGVNAAQNVLKLAQEVNNTKSELYRDISEKVAKGKEVTPEELGQLSMETTNLIYSDSRFTKETLKYIANNGSVQTIAETMFDGNTEAAEIFKKKFSDSEYVDSLMFGENDRVDASFVEKSLNPAAPETVDSGNNQGYNNNTNIDQNGGNVNVNNLDRGGLSESGTGGQNQETVTGTERKTRRTWTEDAESFRRRTEAIGTEGRGRQTVEIGETLFSYIPKSFDGSQASKAVEILNRAGIKAVYCEGDTESNSGGITTVHTEATTGPDGTVYVSSNSSLSAIQIAAHEAIHSKDILNSQEYVEFEAVVCDNILWGSELYVEIAEKINKSHYNGKYDIESYDFGGPFIKELMGYVNGFISEDVTKAAEIFAPMFSNWEAVVEASRKFNEAIGLDFSDVDISGTTTEAADNSSVNEYNNTNTNSENGGKNNAGQGLLRNGSERSGRASANSESGTGTVQETNGGVYGDSQNNRVSGEHSEGIRDSSNRRLTTDQKERLKSSVIKNDDGTPKAVYHFSENMEFENFAKGDIGFHFGNDVQAERHSKGKSGRIIVAHLDIKNPIRFRSDLMFWSPRNTAFMLQVEGIISIDERLYIEKIADGEVINDVKEMYSSKSATELRRILSEKGYDGIVYQNMFEGDGESYIAFYPEQVIIIDDGKGSSSVLQSNANEAADDTLAHPAPTAGKVLKMTPVSARAKNYVKAIGEALGWKVEFGPVHTPKGGKADGKINRNTKTLTIDPTSEKPIEFIFKHELAHIPEQDKGAYADLQNAIMDSKAFKDYVKSLGFETVSAYNADIVARYRTEGVKGFNSAMAEYKANCEMVANFVGDCLFGGNNEVTAKLLEGMNQSQRRSFIQWVKEFFAKLKDKLSGKSKQLTDEISELENAFLKVLNSVGQKENTAETDGESYSFNENLHQQLQDWLNGGGQKNGTYNGSYFELGTTPDVLTRHGAPSADIIMYSDVIVKVTGGKHSISLDEIAKLPAQLNDPILLFKGSVPNSFVALTEIVDKNGNDVIVAVHINKRHSRTVVNKIASLYSKSDDFGNNKIIGYINNQISAGNLIDASNTKAPNWFTSRGLQLPKEVQTILGANNRVAQKQPVVKNKYMQESEDYSNSSTFAEQEDTVDTDDESYSISQAFYSDFDAWDGKDTNKVFTIGTTSEALKSINVKSQEIKMRSGMVLQKLSKHPEISREIFRSIPDLLENPVIVQFSDAIDPNTGKPKYDSRITVLGELYAEMIIDGQTVQKPVLVSLELLPTNQKKTKILDVSFVTSAYGHSKLQSYLNDNSILYIDPNKKRTDKWLSLNRLQLPLGENRTGPIRKITYSGGKVKIQNSTKKTEMQLALEKAGVINSYGNSIFNDTENDTSDSESYSISAPSKVEDAETTAYTETQYNSFGWVRANDILTAAEYNTLLSRYADYKHNKDKYPTTRFGEAVIHSTECPDVIMYVKGSIRSPQITKIIRIDYFDTAEIKEEIFSNERRHLPQPYKSIESFYGKEIFSVCKARDYASFRDYRAEQEGRSGQGGSTSGGAEQDRTGSSSQNKGADNGNEGVSYSLSAPSKVEDVLTRFKNGEITQDEADKLLYNSISGSGDTHYGEHIHHTPSDYKPTSDREWQVFCRSFANQTNGMKDGKYRAVSIFTADAHYLISADGYMSGVIVDKVSIDEYKERKEFYDNIPGADVSDIGNEENGSGQRNHGNSDITSKNEGADSFDVELDAFIDSHPEWFANKRKARSDSSRKIKETAESDESYSVSTSSAEDLLTRYEKGEISREEYLEAVSLLSKEKILSPYDIAQLKPEDAETTAYTETQYNNFGWVRANDVLTPAEYSALLSNYTGHKHKDDYFPITRFGETVLHSSQHNNVLMYAKGNIRNPQITKVVKIEADEINVKEVILRYEREKNPRALEIVKNYFGEWILDTHYRKDYDNYREYRAEQEGRSGQGGSTSGGAEQDRTGSSSQNKGADNGNEGVSYSLSAPSKVEDVLTRFKNGEITQDEAVSLLSKEKILSPYDIAHLKPEDAEVTSGKGNPKREGKGDRESRFYASALGSEIITPEIKAEIEKDTYIKNYQGTTNKRTLSIAAKELSEGGQERAQAFKELAHTPEKASAVDVAVGFILLEGYQRVGNEAAALETAEILAKIGTGAGQTVQLFSIMGRFTPETMIAYVQKDLDKAYEKLVELKSEKWAKNYKDRMNLTEEDIEFIRRRTLQAAMLEDGTRPKEILLAEIVARATDKIPPENGQSMRALQRVSLLLNVRTQLRNVVGNANMAPIFVASDFFGSLLDRQLAKTSGVRTTGNFKFKGRGEAFVRGLAESYDDFKRGIRTRREELNRYDVNGGAGKNFNEHHKKLKQLDGVSRALNKLDNFTSFCLEAGDRSFFEMWFTNSINNQLRLNKTDIPTEEMIEIAREEALQRTWQDNNVVTRSMSQLKKNLNNIRIGKTTYGFGDFVLKFVKTPANIGKAMVEFSPVGFAMATAKGVRYSEALKTGKLTAQMQKELVRSMSNAFTGTVLYALVAVLASLGVIELSGGGDEDKDVSNFEKYIVGVQPYSVKIFGVDVTYSWNQPMGTVLATVADFMESKKDGNDALWYEDVWNAFKTGATVFTEQSFLSSLYELFSADDMMTGISEAALSEPAAFIPQILSQTASFTDPYRRTTYESGKPIQSAINSIIYKIPGLRQALPEQVNVMGETVENNQYLNPWKAFIDPSTSYGESSGAVAEEIYKLYKATGDKTVMPRTAPNDLSIEEKKIVFSAEEKADFQRTIGEKSCEILKELFNSEEYKALSDAKKAKAVAEVYEYVYAKAKAELDIYDYEMLSKIVGTKSNGEAILTKEVYDRLDKKARQRLIDEEFLSKLEIKCNDDPELLAKVFVLKVME